MQPEVEVSRLEKSSDAMGTTFSIILYGESLAAMEEAVSAAFSELHRLDEMLSNYRPDSEWSRLNLSAGRVAVKVSAELFQLLLACEKYSAESEGAFDITVGPLMKLWGFYKGTGRVPAPAEIRTTLGRVGYRHVHLDAAHQIVQFDDLGVELDPGGIGKGYAIDRMVEALRRRGFVKALVAASGSSIYGLGSPPAEPKGWRVTVADPKDPRSIATEVFLRDMALSTSGNREKVFLAEGKTYSHILDPRTGYPAQGTSLVSVLGPRTMDTEAWTKSCFIHGRSWVAGHKAKDFRVFICDESEDPACEWLS
jgi:thiamine biosynthesis lipoprotein